MCLFWSFGGFYVLALRGWAAFPSAFEQAFKELVEKKRRLFAKCGGAGFLGRLGGWGV